MSELPVGQAALGPNSPDDDDPDSNARASFFSRLFRRDASDDTNEQTDDPGRVNGMGSRELRVNLRKLKHMRVDDVSVPRADIIAVPADSDLDEVVGVLRSSEVSRLPVYSETLDRPLGLVHLKDLALSYGFGVPTGEFSLTGLLRPLLYAPPSMPIGVLLQKMQAAHIHMALVIDEYGGVDGLVTIEDLLEQIVGDISDEHDEDESALWSSEGPGVFLAEGRMDLEDFETVIGVQLADADLAEEVDTLGGLVFRLAGRVPVRGEVVSHPAGHEFEVIEADARKVLQLRVRLRQDEGGLAEAAE
jgi:magnesium and cobalt transporter